MMINQPDSNIQHAADQWHILLRSASLTDQQEKDFFEWLNSSDDHQKAYLEAEQLWQRGGALALAEKRARTALKDNRVKPVIWPYPAAVAACVILAVAIFTFNFNKPEQAFKQYQTQIGEQKKVVLDDGSIAILNTNSLLSFNPTNSSQRELALDSGEVFFDVKSDKNKPFTVKTSEGLVVVLGTQFSIIKHPGYTEITVIEGKVGLLRGVQQWRGQTPELELVRNQSLELSSTSSLKPKIVDASKALSWRNGRRYYEQQTLEEVVKDLNRYYDRSFIIGDESLKGKRVVAMIPIENSFDKTRIVLEKTLRLRSQESANQKKVILLPGNSSD